MQLMKLILLMCVLLATACGAPLDEEELRLGTAEQAVTMHPFYGVERLVTAPQRAQCDRDKPGAFCTLPDNKIVYVRTNALPALYVTALQSVINYIESFAPAWDFYLNASGGVPDDLVIGNAVIPGTPAVQDMPKYDVMRAACLDTDPAWGPESYAASFNPCVFGGATFDWVKFDAWMTHVGASTLGKANYRFQAMCALLGVGALGLGDWGPTKNTCSSELFTGKAGSGVGGAKMTLLGSEINRLVAYDPTGGGVNFPF